MSTVDANRVHECLSGRPEAFGALYDEYAPKIYAYHYYRTFHVETAEDLTSQTFLRALEFLSSFNPAKGSFSAWIYRIARNVLIDHARKIRPTTDLEEVVDILPDSTNLQKTTEERERLEQVQRLLSDVSPEQREILLLRLWDDLSYADIAQMTGKTEAACKMTVSRVLKTIRTTMPLALLLLILRTKLLA